MGERMYTPRGNLDKTQRQHDREKQGRKQSHHSAIPVQIQDERIQRNGIIRYPKSANIVYARGMNML